MYLKCKTIFSQFNHLNHLNHPNHLNHLNRLNHPNHLIHLNQNSTMSNSDSLIPSGDDPKKLISYQKADTVFQITYYFATHYIARGDRTTDQMIQAARSGKQNIIEGCAAASTSTKTELHLLNVAKASLKEVLADYEDYLNTRGFVKWKKGSIEYDKMRELGAKHNDASYFMDLIQTRPPQTIANMAIILLNQADYLLHRQIQRRAKDFLENGGFQERMYRLRSQSRNKSIQTPNTSNQNNSTSNLSNLNPIQNIPNSDSIHNSHNTSDTSHINHNSSGTPKETPNKSNNTK